MTKIIFLVILVTLISFAMDKTQGFVPKNSVFVPPTEIMLKELAECESGRNEDAYNPKDPISGSYGPFQFKLGTTKWYLKKFKMKIPPDNELLDLLFTYNYSKELARRILDEGHWENWYNCLHKYYE